MSANFKLNYVSNSVADVPEFAMPTQRRERHYSSSQSSSHGHHTPHKYMPTMHPGGRIRTESGCSAFSDTHTPSSKSRKVDDTNHRILARRDFVARFNNGVPDKANFKMFDMIFYNPTTNPMDIKPNLNKLKAEMSASDTSKPAVDADADVDSKTEQLEKEEKPAALPVPQLKLNSQGELILDDKSLEIETTAEQEARKTLANSSLIFLDENTGMNGFYRRQKRTKDWPHDETVKFYRCLQIIGTDFSLMCPLFPKRSRRDLKLKFKKEERSNGLLINKALLYPKIFNIDELKQQLETEEREREETERRWKEIKEQKKNMKKVGGGSNVRNFVFKKSHRHIQWCGIK